MGTFAHATAARPRTIDHVGRSSNFDQPITPSAIVIRDCSDQGAQRLPAIKAGKRGIFVQQSGRRIYELLFNGQEMDYDERDLTRLNLDIGAQGFVDIDKSTQPDKIDPAAARRRPVRCAALRREGRGRGVVADPDAGGDRKRRRAAVTERAGGSRLFRGPPRHQWRDAALHRDGWPSGPNCVGGAINQQLDCHVVYQGSPTSTIALPQLPNTLVSVWADGAAIGSGTTDGSGNLAMPDGKAHANIVAGLAGVVIANTATSATATLAVGTQYNGYPARYSPTSGRPASRCISVPPSSRTAPVTLPNGQTARTIIACLGYVAPFMSAKLAYAAQLGSALTQSKRIDHVGLVLYDANYPGHPVRPTLRRRSMIFRSTRPAPPPHPERHGASMTSP